MAAKLLIAIIIAIIGIIVPFYLYFVAPFIGVPFIREVSPFIFFICYLIIYRNYRKQFLKSLIIGFIIGIPLIFYLEFGYLGYLIESSSPQDTEKTEGFEQVHVSWPFFFTTEGNLLMIIENRVGSIINVKRIFADTDPSIDYVDDVDDIRLRIQEVSNVTTNFPELKDNSGSIYKLYVEIEYELAIDPGEYFNSSGIIRGRRVYISK